MIHKGRCLLGCTTTLRRIGQKVVQRIKRDGVLATLSRAVEVILWESRKLDPVFRERERESREYDSLYNVDTSGKILKEDLSFPKEVEEWCNWYEPTPPYLIREFVRHLPEDLSNFHWIDLGSGKGRVVFMCSRYRMKAITGIELSPWLYEISVQNQKSFRDPNQQTFSLNFLHGDAQAIVFPSDDLIISLYNSFTGPVLEAVLDNLRRSLEELPREAYLIYVNPLQADVVEQSGMFEKIAQGDKYKIFGAKRR